MLLMQIKGKKYPVSVYEALTPSAAEPLSEQRPRRFRVAVEGSETPDDTTQHSHAMQCRPSSMQTPLIGADFMLTQVRCVLMMRQLS